MTAKIILLDIETAPGLGWAWEKYDTNIIEFEQSWYMLCYSWKELNGDSIRYSGLDLRGRPSDVSNLDKGLVEGLWKVFDDADIIIAHNGDAFDIRKSNARFVRYGLPPPSTYKTVDTLKLARKHFRFESNSLSDLAQHLEIGKKAHTGGFGLWKGCMNGDPESWKKMEEYNKHDIELLEDVYLRLRPWSNTHPDVSLYDGGSAVCCPTCGSGSVQRRGRTVAKTRTYQRLNCKSCGSWFQGDYIKAGSE